MGNQAVEDLIHGWVDEVFLLQPDGVAFPTRFLDSLVQMGIQVSYTIAAVSESDWFATEIGRVGPYKVLTSSVRFISAGQYIVKRLIDIAGGIVGCAITGVLCLFVGPAIYLKSPGPIFFTQERVGQNGKPFRMHKFRSMYLDAEKRKADLMAQNKIADGMMFKMDDDPRIIGSEKKDKNGNPKGIGNFIRNTSLDEFPQFWNVLKGDMSLVGTRPPTLDEWEKYSLHHRIRMSAKPGITGMWQVRGRSKITDFEEVVALDRYYIEHWSLWLDLKILLKTVMVVLRHEGAS
jgi:lipopolysaccharide/colanic/teichoic acid biosynthesis glycosyltransferase